MMQHTTVQALGRAHLAELQRQAQRDALARAARQARRQRSGHRAPAILTVMTAWARRPRPAPESP
jgi:DNA-binding TFAR19-related protein (PDSD5 family)